MNVRKMSVFIFSAFILLGCDASNESKLSDNSDSNNSESLNSHYLYVASGICYSGGIRTFSSLTSSNLVYRIGLLSGQKNQTIVDYNQAPSQVGDSPAAIDSIDGNNLFILVENKTTPLTRRIEKISRKGGTREVFNSDALMLSRRLRDLVLTADGSLLINKGDSIEKLSADNVQIKAPFIYKPSGDCADSEKLISKILTLNNGDIVYLHAYAGQNKIGVISAEGYTTTADCKGSQAAPRAESFPVAAVYDGGGHLIVAYAGKSTAVDVNSIYAYDVDSTTNALSNPQKIYDVSQFPGTYSFMLYGISAMAIDILNKNIYIATAINNHGPIANYAIEKFDYHPEKLGAVNTEVLTRVGNTAFYPYGADTKCISALKIGP